MEKVALFISVAFLFSALAGCEEGTSRGVGKALTRPVEKSRVVADDATLRALRSSIEARRALNGAYPEDLDEIAGAMGIDPSLYEYDPSTGRVAPKRF